MTDDIQSLRDDIAYLKALADGGQGRETSGGVLLMGAGLLFGGASLFQWLAMERLLPIGPDVANLSWLIATLLFLGLLIGMKLRWRSEGSSGGAGGYAWQGVGMGCFFIFVALAIATWRTQNMLLVFFAPSIIFILYGAAWTAVGAALRKGWVQITGWASFIAAGITAWFIGQAVSYLIYAVGLMLLAFLPGLIFALNAPRPLDAEA
jgi:hypothetical protein